MAQLSDLLLELIQDGQNCLSLLGVTFCELFMTKVEVMEKAHQKENACH